MSEPGREVTLTWRGAPVRAWLPDPLGGRVRALSEPTVRTTERAAAAVREVSMRMPTGFEPLARLLLRAEGLASSRVEGIEAPLDEVVRAEVETAGGAAAHVADNLGVVDAALAHALGGEALSEDRLHDWHRQLMAHGALTERSIGRWRDEIGWIGGASPVQAVYVPAPPDAIAELMKDLIDHANQPSWDPVTAAALVHAQFETIHPYGDGNGRLGRVLVLWFLVRHLRGVVVPPPMSVLIARDTNAYISALGAFRIGEDDLLVGWFASVLIGGAEASLEWAGQLDALAQDWERRVRGIRAGSAARRLLPVLARFPVLSAEVASEQLGVSLPAARNGLDSLVDHGVVRDLGTAGFGGRRPRRWWSAPELLELVQRWAV